MARYKNLGDDLKAMFPEQTKTVPRIICWSIILVIDIIAVCVLAVRWELFDWIDSRLAPVLIIAAVLLLFWLEGFVFYKIRNLFL